MRRSITAAASAAAVFFASATAAFATPTVSATRLEGETRYETAHEIALATNSPVVLTEPDRLTPDALQTLQDLDADGVIIVGGFDAVSAAVEEELEANGFTPERLRGSNRYETAQAMAESLPQDNIGSRDSTVGRTAFLATGEKFPDALAAGPIAYDFGFPVLLTTPNSLGTPAREAIETLDIREVIILGGEAAISSAVAEEVQAMGIAVLRIGGADRMETAADLADLALAQLDFGSAHVNLARGDLFADALVGGSHGGEEQTVILLTQDPHTLGAATVQWLSGHEDTVASIHVFGGIEAVTDATVQAARGAAGATGG